MAQQLEIVKQETKTNALMTEPMPQVELQIGSCEWINERGSREGERCGEKTFDGEPYCTSHQKTAARRKAKEASVGEILAVHRKCKEEKKDEVVKEVSVEMKASAVPQVPIINVAQPLPAPVVLPPQPIVVHAAPNPSIDEILVIMRNFSIAMVNLTELLKKH